MSAVLALIGGPLDGVYIPVNSQTNEPPSELFVHCPEFGTWSVYRNENVGGVASCDVYVLRRGALVPLAVTPRNKEIFKLDYTRPLSPEEVVEVERIGRSHGL